MTRAPRTADRLSSGRKWISIPPIASLLILCVAIGVIPHSHHEPVLLIVAFFLLLLISLAVTFTWPRTGSLFAQGTGILFVALLARLALLPFPADTDVNRFLWEGSLITAGYDPYTEVASATTWAGFRDVYWQGINQKDLRTIYPPVIEWLFAGVGKLWYHPVALKIAFIVFDLGSVALLLAMLAHRSQPPRLAGLYAFNPVPLIGFAAEGHFDSILIFFVLLSLWLRERGRTRSSWAALGLAIQIKLAPILLVPLFLRKGGWRTVWVCALIVVLPFLLYAREIGTWLSGVRHFGAGLGFNGPVHALLSIGTGDRTIAAILCAGALLCLSVVATSLEPDRWRAAFFSIGGLIVLSPIVHYWYLSWALAFVPLFPSLSWLLLSGLIGLYFLTGLTPDWSIPVWARLTIWLPFGLLLVREGFHVLRPILIPRLRRAASGTDKPDPSICSGLANARSLAIVIPALNEAPLLSDCLLSVTRMAPRPDEVIVVDGGSTDETRDVAARHGTSVIMSDPGRGTQIAAGVAQAKSEVVLVVHADSLIAPNAAERLFSAMRARPQVVGGAIGQRFDDDALNICLIECLNEVKLVLFGLSFGDQGQFFKRNAVMAAGGFPSLSLMEDLELCLRLRELGPTVYLGGGLVCSGRRWRNIGWLRCCITVLAMMAIYLVRRREGAQIADTLYRRYYRQDGFRKRKQNPCGPYRGDERKQAARKVENQARQNSEYPGH
jgi:glycosyl transferase family 2/glycosyl transferase family 87